MKVKVSIDRRNAMDKKWDAMWNTLVRSAKLSPTQSNLVAKYVRDLMALRVNEIESACDMAWLLALIESEGFGTDANHGAKRLLRVQQKCADIRNEEYGHNCIDANGQWQNYDGCGVEHLQKRLKDYGVEYDMRLGADI